MATKCAERNIRSQGRKVREHRREDLITKILDVAYDRSAIAPNWLRFLAVVFNEDTELINFIHKIWETFGFSVDNGAQIKSEDKNFHMIRYLGFYSNRKRGERAKAKPFSSVDDGSETIPKKIYIIDVSEYQPKRVPSLTWRECIKKI